MDSKYLSKLTWIEIHFSPLKGDVCRQKLPKEHKTLETIDGTLLNTMEVDF